MDAIEALRIARLALAMHFDIEPDVVAGRYVERYVAIGAKKCDLDAAESYNKLAEMQAETCRCTTLQYVLDEWAKELAPSMDYVQANPDEFNARCGDSKLAVINAAFMAGRN